MKNIEPIRLNRFLAQAGFGSRRSCENLIRDGKVVINGRVVKNLAVKVSPSDQVVCEGKQVRKASLPVALILNKPRGYICSKASQGKHSSVYELLPAEAQTLFYVGRLDVESQGLLLFTNDGDLANQLTHPRYKVTKLYHVTLDRSFDFSQKSRLLKGMKVEGKQARFDQIYALQGSTVKVALSQGIKREIRTLFGYLNYDVKKLVRVKLGNLLLRDLPIGRWRWVSKTEIAQLRELIKS